MQIQGKSSCGSSRGNSCGCGATAPTNNRTTPPGPRRDYIGEAMQQPSRIFLCSFRPLAYSVAGRMAVEQHGLPPFIDASCRREPDFESTYPAITALCRKEHFAPRLRVESKVVYITKKAKYLGASESHWRLVAILEVDHSFPTHQIASEWYQEKGLRLPSNCMASGNLPLGLDMTDRINPDISSWDAAYRLRAEECGVFHVCRTIYRELNHPPTITNAMMTDIFGRIPGTQMPPAITEDQYQRLHRIAFSRG